MFSFLYRLPIGWRILLPFGSFLLVAFLLINWLGTIEINNFEKLLYQEEEKIVQKDILIFEKYAQNNALLAKTIDPQNPPKNELKEYTIEFSINPANKSIRPQNFWELTLQEKPVAKGVAYHKENNTIVEVTIPLKYIATSLEKTYNVKNGIYYFCNDKIVPEKKLIPEKLLKDASKEFPSYLIYEGKTFIAWPLKNAHNKTWGFYVKETEIPFLKKLSQKLLKQNATFAFSFIMIALLTTFSIIKYFVCLPLEDLKKQIQEISRGLGKRLRTDIQESFLKIYGKDEISNLARCINDLIKELDELASFRQSIESDESPEEIYERLADAFESKFKLNKFAIFEIQKNKKDKIILKVRRPKDSNYETCLSKINDNPKLCKVYRSASIASSKHFATYCSHLKNETDYICLPIKEGSKVIGIVNFQVEEGKENSQKIEAIKEKAAAYLQEAAPIIEAKKLAKKLRELSLRDGLTGIYNKRLLEDLIPQISAGILRRKSRLGVIMFDIDYFKKINDQYGHPFGDFVLKKIATLLTSLLRKSDFAIRYGGEEFLVLLLDTKPDFSVKVAERIRKQIEKSIFTYDGKTTSVTISVGVAEFPTDDTDLVEVIKFADIALYEAKKRGRNQVVRFKKEFLLNKKDNQVT